MSDKIESVRTLGLGTLDVLSFPVVSVAGKVEVVIPTLPCGRWQKHFGDPQLA